MNRREVVKGLALMLGAELVPPLRMAVANGLDPVSLEGASLFTGSVRADMAALAEVIIPATDTPGAAEAGVARFIEFMLQTWYPESFRQPFLEQAEALRADCLARNGMPYSELPDRDRQAIMQRLHDGTHSALQDGGKDFFNHLKQLTLFGYYTSEIGMTVERRYLPVPGRYDGAYPYAEVQTLFTS